MASNAEEFILKLTQQISGPAAQATGALAQLEAQIAQEQSALSGLESELAAANASLQLMGEGVDGSVNVAAFRRQQSAVVDLQGAVSAAQAELNELEGARAIAAQADQMKAAAAEAKKAAASLPTGQVNVLAESFGRIPGPIGRVGQRIFGLADGLKKMGGAAGLSTTVLVAGAAVALVAVLALGVGIVSITKTLIGWADTTGRLGKAQETLTKNLKATFGGAIKIDGFLAGIDRLVGLFEKSSSTGKALAFITATIFQPLIDGATAAIPLIERAFIVAITWALRAYIAVVRFSRSDVGQALITGLKIVAVLIAAIVAVAGIAVALIALPFALAAAAVAAVVAAIGFLVNKFRSAGDTIKTIAAVIGAVLLLPFAPFIAVAAAAWAAVSGGAAAAWEAIQSAVGAAIDWIASVPGRLVEIGANMMQSLADGILGAASAVVGAITGAVGGAIDAAKSALGIASPSTVFAAMGRNVDESMAGGAEGGATQTALTEMVAPPSPVAVKTAAKGEKSAGRIAYFEIHGDADGVVDKIRALLRAEFETESLSLEPT